ncbi:disease resistance RPP13-like protein 1 [Pyrus ussuriensis x Pyrus communis]|uniref:Disease resistance RPP13-like protein 1 n=1 Tax=Pyrus ussuriensis x Pyrus communis TaxID=2448454 RepID=A0A5N5FYX4_9ROSA|nr:disease resistance RPP13-like protein 1 [Pyrus ussuriensis x Pyrus communis]
MGVGRGSGTFTVPLPPQPSLLSPLCILNWFLRSSLDLNWICGCREFVGRTVGVGWWWVLAEVVRWCELIKGWG